MFRRAGNHAMTNILSTSRADEQAAAGLAAGSKP
jgi:hypothetical protein